MTSDDSPRDDDLPEFLRKMFENAGAGENPFAGGIDPEQMKRLSEQLGASGIDPAMFQPLMASMQQAFSQASDDGIAWDAAKRQALHLANQDGHAITTGAKTDLDQAFALADLWLSEATTISELAAPARPITRGEWVELTLPVWQELAEPVATSMADGLIEALRAQSPDDMQQMLDGAGRMLRSIGGQMFATQLGQVIGRLSREVVSGGDVGIPVMPAGTAAIVPQNFEDLGRGLEIPDDQLALYIAARELAHARLFRHAKWLRLQAIAQVTDFARGVDIDVERLEELAARFDPQNPEELKQALESGALLPEQSEAQKHALERLETQLALIEGWVDVVTADATSRMPGGERFTEVVRRRRAAGGPAEDALEALVGLRLRPRRLREAAAMWRAVTDAVGIEARDTLWDYPDMMPSGGDIDDPSALIARLEARARGEEPAPDDMDQALAQLLAEAADDGASSDGAPGGGDAAEGDAEPGDDDKPQT